jgi:hypothetical protein
MDCNTRKVEAAPTFVHAVKIYILHVLLEKSVQTVQKCEYCHMTKI